ncbi:MoaD/ThiS family protein [Cyanobium sp. ATX 6F1]|uniref:MoaD/ThiS family protein n=1 Tax=unclassified Cyanobium TaxID=2627006 RepID=UPI0020CF89FA|nr:MoaD/ThiS family protein [Cyanobium sp. ATX 6F1]MCP9917142.1 MoaD/ThiS family protein [Cyanobium sp. ATX 6F1]
MTAPEATPTITVRLFARLREQAGWGERTVPLGEGVVSAAEIWERLGLGPSPLPAPLRVAINQQFAAADARLRAGDELAFLPPISGG